MRFEQLHVHTCKTGDGRDVWFHPCHDADTGVYRIKGGAGGDAEGKCLESQSANEGASIDAVDCNAAAMDVQDWAFCSDGTIRNGGINNGVADFGSAEMRAANSMWARNFHLGKCDGTDAKLTTWEILKHVLVLTVVFAQVFTCGVAVNDDDTDALHHFKLEGRFELLCPRGFSCVIDCFSPPNFSPVAGRTCGEGATQRSACRSR